MFMSNTACFTGHRPNKLGGYNENNPIAINIKEKLKIAIIYAIEKQNIINFISGMAMGVDMWAVEILIDIKKSYPHIKIVGAIPFLGQETKWYKETQIKYNNLLKQLDKIEYVSSPGYSAYKMQIRNEWMVNHSKIVIAVWDGTPGGTANCVKYARSKNKKIIHLLKGGE